MVDADQQAAVGELALVVVEVYAYVREVHVPQSRRGLGSQVDAVEFRSS
jgi:hypothetical protein